MLGFVQNIFALRKLFAPPSHPMGVDFGTDCLRIAQVQQSRRDFNLHAAACTDVPPDVRADPGSHLAFFAQAVPHLLAQAPFRGRQAVLGLPASVVHIQNLTLPPTPEENLKDAIVREASRRLPFDPSHALIRHTVVGEAPQTAGLQVIAMAADARWVNKYLEAARAARLNVVAMNVQPLALLDCFARAYRRTSELESTRFYIDIGSSGTRAMIARGTRLLFARNIVVGGDHLTRSLAESLGIGFHDARMMRIKLGASPLAQAGGVDSALQDALDKLIRELEDCHCDHQAIFPEFPVERLIFVGGEARQRGLCKRIAKRLGVPGQTGDSLRHMAPSSNVGIESAIDRRHPQPAWAAAIGLSIGPAASGE
ncbi:MAG: pilus assembly protein PilM [Tepidisphaeraceae bacterium]